MKYSHIDLISRKFAAISISGILVAVLFTFISEPVLAIISVRIESATAGGHTLGPYGIETLNPGESTKTVIFTYSGTRGPMDTSPLTGFRCLWIVYGQLYTIPYPSTWSCPNNAERPIVPGTTNTGYTMLGSDSRPQSRGTYEFSAEVLNRAGSYRETPLWIYTIAAPPRPGVIDTSLPPQASVYKANSYNSHATSYVPGSMNNQYHTQDGQSTPYDHMYLVLEGVYTTTPANPRPVDHDTFQNVPTHFYCKWDTDPDYSLCGRINFVQRVSPGFHSVEFKAINPQGILGPSNLFFWCVTSTSPCTNAFTPTGYHIINPQTDVAGYNSAENASSFYSGENQKPIDLKQFQIINLTKGGNNQTISLKDLKEFALLNATSSPKDTFLYKPIKISNENITNATVLGLKERIVNKTGNESNINAK